jgi:DNA-binding GntR family transcriptional regulator
MHMGREQSDPGDGMRKILKGIPRRLADQPTAARPGRRGGPTRSLTTRSASEIAYVQLRQSIIACERPPGERLTESEVANRMRAGKTPVREALRRLVHEGLVVVRPRQGYAVAPISLRDVEDLCGLRLIVEPAAVTLATGRLDRARTSALDELCHVGYDVTKPESVRAFLHANRLFHATIADACGNRKLAALVDQLLVESQRIIQFGMLLHPQSQEAVHSHEALLAALRRKRAPEARRLVEEEIHATERMVVESILRSSTLRTVAVGAL